MAGYSGFNPNIYIMNIKNYTWVNMFDPNEIDQNPSPPSSSQQPSSNSHQPSSNSHQPPNNYSKVIIASVTLLIVLVILVCVFFIYRYRRIRAKRRIDHPFTPVIG